MIFILYALQNNNTFNFKIKNRWSKNTQKKNKAAGRRAVRLARVKEINIGVLVVMVLLVLTSK